MLETAWTSIPEVDIVLFVVQPTSKGINEADKQILEKLKATPTLTAEILSKVFGVAQRTIERDLRNLKENGYIERVESDKTGYWKVK